MRKTDIINWQEQYESELNDLLLRYLAMRDSSNHYDLQARMTAFSKVGIYETVMNLTVNELSDMLCQLRDIDASAYDRVIKHIRQTFESS